MMQEVRFSPGVNQPAGQSAQAAPAAMVPGIVHCLSMVQLDALMWSRAALESMT